MFIDNSFSSSASELFESKLHKDPVNSAEKQKGLRCFYTNSDFLQNKLELLEEFVLKNKIDIIAVTETLDKFVPVNDQQNLHFILPGFTSFQKNSGRGVCLFVREGLTVTRLEDCESLFDPSIFCKISPNKEEHFVMGVVYRSPNSSNEENMKLLNQISYVSEKVLQSKSKLLLVGDFNYKEIDWPNEYCPGATEKNSVKFLNCIQKNFLTQFVSSATHKRGDQCPTLIDLIISNEPDFVQNVEHHAPLGSSHHEILTFSIDQGIPPQTIKTPEKYLLEKGDYTAMRKEVGEINWEEILKDSDDVDQWWGSIENVINSAAEKHIPKKKTSKKHIKRSFYAPPSLLQAIQLKRKTYKYYKKYPTEKNFASYVKIRNIVNVEVSQTKCQKEQKIAREAKNNPKALFQYINKKTKPRETVPDLTKPNGELTENSQEKAQVLNEFLGVCSLMKLTQNSLTVTLRLNIC